MLINLDSYSLSQWNVVSFKLDNSYLGLKPNFLAENDTSNYNYFYFNGLNMVIAQKKTANSITNVGIGTASGTLDYQRDFKFAWVRVYSTTNAPTATMPKTLKFGRPALETLAYLTTYSSATITKQEGAEYQGSTVMYKTIISVPIIPLGG